MAIKTNNMMNLFFIKAKINFYPILQNVSVVKGELLYFHEEDGITYVTNQITGDESAKAVAIKSGGSLDKIPCYILERS